MACSRDGLRVNRKVLHMKPHHSERDQLIRFGLLEQIASRKRHKQLEQRLCDRCVGEPVVIRPVGDAIPSGQ